MKKSVLMLLAVALLLCTVIPQVALASGSGWEEVGTTPDSPYVYFYAPYGIAVDASDGIYVADGANHRVKKYTPKGVLDTSWGGGDGIIGGERGAGIDQFDGPYAVAVDAAGNLYVADFVNDRIKHYNTEGELDTTWGINGIIGGSSAPGELDAPMGIVVDSSGRLYVADTGNDRIKRYTSSGALDTTWGGGDGVIGGSGSGDLEFNTPGGLALDDSGRLYVADSQNHRVKRYTNDGTAENGTLDTSWGGGDGIVGTGSHGSGPDEFYYPADVALDAFGSLYVSDEANHRVKRYTPAGELDTTWGGGDGIIGMNLGVSYEQFMSPIGVDVDSSGRLYVVDEGNFRIKRYTADGSLDASWCEGGILAGVGDGALQFNRPGQVAVDPATGDFYVADCYNHRIKRYLSDLTLDTSWANGGILGGYGSDYDKFLNPSGVAVDSNGNIYVSDTGNDRVKRYTSEGVLDTAWGGGDGIIGTGSPGTGPYAFNTPWGVCVDSDDNLYVADFYNECVKRYTSAGLIDTAWGGGDGIIGTEGVGGTDPESFGHPRYLCVSNGCLYVTDFGVQRLVRYTAEGVLDTSFANGGVLNGNGGSDVGEFGSPKGVAVDEAGNIYIVDGANDRICSFKSDGTVNTDFAYGGVWYQGLVDRDDAPLVLPEGIEYYEGRLYCAWRDRISVLCNGVALLDSLSVNGKPVSGFDPETFSYDIVVHKDAKSVTISADAKYVYSGVSGTGALALSEGGSQFDVKVTSETGNAQIYTVNVLRDGTEVGLSALSVDGTAVTGFSTDDTSYTVTVPYGREYVGIGATGNSYCEEITGAGAVKLTGDSTDFTVIAKAEDGTAKAYTLTVKKESPAATTFKLTADGERIGSSGMSIVVPEDGKTVMLRVTLSDGTYTDFPLSLTVQNSGSNTGSSGSTGSSSSGTEPTESNGDKETIPDTGDASDIDIPFTLSVDGTVISADAQIVIPDGGKTAVITIKMPDGSVYEIPIELVPEASAADSAVDVNEYDIGGAAAFAWWWIAIGVLALALAGAGVWVYMLKKSSVID